MTAHKLVTVVASEFEAVEVRFEPGMSANGQAIDRLYITFPLGYSADGVTPESILDNVLEQAKAQYGSHVTGASWVPLITANILDIRDEACIAVGNFHGMPLQPQAVTEGDEPFTTDVVNGDLDDAETAFGSAL